MADTTTSANNTVQQWDDDFFVEYVRNNRFSRYMGSNENSVIQMVEDLTRKAGDRITVQLVSRLQGAGVSGNTALEGSEEALNNFGHAINVTTRRNGVVVTDEEQQKSNIDFRNAARMQLMTWSMEQIRGGASTSQSGIIEALGAIATADGGNTLYASASEANKDTWLANNADRVLFGAAVSNNSGNDHSASLANIDNTNDQLSAAIVSLAKRRAKTADPHIRPIRTREDEEWYVMFANSLAFRDLKEDSTFAQANREARERGLNNPLFRDGDLVYDGVIIREVPEIAVLTGVGAGSIDVAPNYLCGAQAVGIAWAQRWRSRLNNTDYEFRKGVGIHANYGTEKLFFNTSQHGVHTVYTAGVADA